MATITLNRPGLEKVRRLAKIKHDHEFATRIEVDATTVSRVLTGKSDPGAKFIAGCIAAFGADCFNDCFIVAAEGGVAA